MKFALYRHNPYWVGGAYRPVLRAGKPITFNSKKEGEDWLAKYPQSSKRQHTTFGIRRLIKEVK